MSGTNVLFGQVAVVFGILIAGVWSATQWTASALGYQVRLGAPWFDLSGTPIYYPWKLFEWWFVWRPDCRRQRVCSRARGNHHVDLAFSAIAAGHDLRLGALGQCG